MAITRSLAAITGASSGIGRVFARKLAPSHDLLLIARRGQLLAALADELVAQHGAVVRWIEADLAQAADLSRVAHQLAAEPELALLINNAGFGMTGPFWDADPERLDSMQRLHVMATMRLCQAALRSMLGRGSGAIINVASVASFVRRAGSASYGASKSWIAAFTEALYLDLKKAQSPVTVQALCPGYTYSEFHDILGVDRKRLASSAFWMSAEQVVDRSLASLTRGQLFVIPGWRYRLLCMLITKLPTSLRLYIEAATSPKLSPENKSGGT
ncbi:MAG: SDR family NAD(P)-dependent oxidoreductase [Steroidobacteraceae bacterium]|jgi:short-subunit dehydrogenase